MPFIKRTTVQVFLIISFLVVAGYAQAQIPDKIIESFKDGNAKTLAEFFNQNVELVVLDNDNVYSKAQAQQIVNKFFTNNTPESFNVIHKGGKEGASYVIGNLKTQNGSFRVYFLLKTSDGKEFIHQLRIEKQ